MAVLANGATAARSMAARLADIVSIEDFGVVDDPTGAYVAANTAAYQNAISVAAGAARLRHRTGLSVVVSTLLLPSNAYLELDGLITLAPAVNGPVLHVTGSGVIIRGYGTINGNRSAQTAPGGGCAGINTAPSGAANLLIEDITITNCYAWPFNLTNIDGCWVNRVKATNCTNSAEFGGQSNNCWADQCQFSGIPDDTFAFYQGCTNSGITRSILSGGGAYGVIILTDGGNTNYSSNILVADNTITGMSAGGLSASVSSVTTQDHQNIKFLRNYLSGNCLNNSTPFDINLSNCISVDVIGNFSQPSGASGGTSAVYGVNIQSSVGRYRVNNNTFDSGNVISGINAVPLFFGGGNNGEVNGNTINSVGNKFAFGLDGNIGLTTIVSNTKLIGSLLGSMLQAAPASDTIFRDNSFIPNQGAVPPASTNIATTSGATYTATQDCVIYIQGTLTGVYYTRPGYTELNLGASVPVLPMRRGDQAVFTWSGSTPIISMAPNT
jgi:hypothetical protein